MTPSSAPPPSGTARLPAGRFADRLYGGRDDIDSVFRKLELMTSVGATIGAVEQLATAETLADDGLFAWPVMRLRAPLWWRRAGEERLEKVFGYPGIVGLVQTRALTGLGLVLPGATRAQRGVLAATMCGTAHGLHTRMGGFGLDGSDHLTFVNYAVSAAEKAFGHDPRAREMLVRFLAAQVCMAYFTSGAAKLISPVWRDGTAIPEIFRTSTFGDPLFHRAVRDRPWLAKSVAWATILGEMAFPLVLVAPKPVARGILASGTVFHLGNARFMGLNRFVWSYCSTYPALAHVSRSLGPRARTAAPAGSPAGSPAASLTASAATAGRLLRAAAGPRGAAAVTAGAGLALLAGAAVRQAGRARDARLRRDAPGELLTVAGRTVHVLPRNSAADGPSVVFENGLAAPATQWGWVQRGLDPRTPSAAYDRPGIGWSDAADRPQGPDEAADVLAETLRTLGLKPPYVLVGHSIGGLLVRTFARRHPELTGGLVFVDATHPEQFVRSPRQREALPWIRQRMTTTGLQAALGLLRYSSRPQQMSGLPAPLGEATERIVRRPRLWRTAREELAESQRTWCPDARRPLPATDTPVAVVTAGETVRSDPLHAEFQRELALLSTVSRHDVVEEAGHESLVLDEAHAAHVVRAVEWARTRAAGGAAPVVPPKAGKTAKARPAPDSA
ncbi:alpha/beta fold hydrolase [Streptomyces sp. NPDC004134]|uniref:alpha/beta fold hydrolase n=1 Tax=Streptomyces sp. NPDC004134 TaxID=3364691 RepID=UPI00368AF239